MQFSKRFNVQGRQIHTVIYREARVIKGVVATLMTTWLGQNTYINKDFQ
jgi:hypothetical protein